MHTPEILRPAKKTPPIFAIPFFNPQTFDFFIAHSPLYPKIPLYQTVAIPKGVTIWGMFD